MVLNESCETIDGHENDIFRALSLVFANLSWIFKIHSDIRVFYMEIYMT